VAKGHRLANDFRWTHTPRSNACAYFACPHQARDGPLKADLRELETLLLVCDLVIGQIGVIFLARTTALVLLSQLYLAVLLEGDLARQRLLVRVLDEACDLFCRRRYPSQREPWRLSCLHALLLHFRGLYRPWNPLLRAELLKLLSRLLLLSLVDSHELWGVELTYTWLIFR